MIVIICAKYKKNPSRTVDATERTRFCKSRPNDLEDIGQGRGSSHATHPLMLLIICTKYGKNPSWTVDATGRTRKVNGQTDGQTDRRTDRQTGWIQYTPPNFVAGGIKREKFAIKFQDFAYSARKRHHFDDLMPKRCNAIAHVLLHETVKYFGPYSWNKIWWLCLVPTSITRFASEVGYRMAKIS